MAIPDHVIFGSDLNHENSITYKEVREIEDDNVKIKLLKNRLKAYFLDQVHPISELEDNGQPKIWSPFPLTVLTCIGVETLGRVICDVDNYGKNEASRIVSIFVFGKLDKRLSRKPGKKFKQQMKGIWSKDDISSIKSYAELFYKYLRTSFNHGYRAKNVFLDHELKEGWRENDGFLEINPYWFWNAFVDYFEECFEIISDDKQQHNRFRENALKYFEKLIS